MPEVITIETPSLGDRSYLAHDGEVGVVIDPQRDIDRMMSVASGLGIRVTHVLETHMHNDYVTGGYELARVTGAAYGVSDRDTVAFDRMPVSDGLAIATGSMSVTAMHTPGHTPGHMSYVLAGAGGAPEAVFTGGSLLFGAVGRTDLISPDQTDQLTRAQFRSARRLADTLPDSAAVYPTHGFGSFCAAATTSGNASTIGQQRQVNVALVNDEETFVKQLIAGLGAYPRYYAHMDRLNRSGPGAPRLEPPARASAQQIRDRIDAGEWVVDLRERRAFASLHVAGTVSVELGNQFATYLGWVLPWDAPLTLLGDSLEEVAQAQLQLSRIGIDRVAAAGVGPTRDLAAGKTGSYEVADFAALAAARDGQNLVVLDVRAPEEWQASHLEGAVNIPLWELADRVGELPEGVVWVHCAGGFRASMAASLLRRAGRQVVYVDDSFARAAEAGLSLVSAA